MIYEIGSGGMKPLSNAGKNELEIGRVLQWHGYAEDQEVIVKRLDFDTKWGYGQKYIAINRRTKTENRHDALTLSWESENKKGIHVAITDEIASPDEIMDLVQASQAQKLIAEAEAQKKADAKAEGYKMLPSMYPFLETIKTSKKSSHALGAANIKKELAKEFPGLKFSVKSDSYSGGCSIDVSWENGPTADSVDAVIKKYSYASFDGMQDLETIKDEIFTDVFGGAKYVFSRREVTQEKYTETAHELGYHESFYDPKNGNISGVTREISDMVKRKTWEKSFYRKPESAQEKTKIESVKQESENKAGVCTLGEYKGHPTITLPNGFTFGLSKAIAIMDNLEEIKKFINQYKKEN